MDGYSYGFLSFLLSFLLVPMMVYWLSFGLEVNFQLADKLRLVELLHLRPVVKSRFPISSLKGWRSFLRVLKEVKTVLD